MQMGRWFGYRPGYTHLCRVYAPATIVENFRTIALATEELRREFSRMCFLGKRPTEYGLRVREPRADLLVTAMNKMRRGESVRVHFAESLVSSLDIPKASVLENYRAFVDLLDAVEADLGVPIPGNKLVSGQKGSFHHRWEEVESTRVVEFLKRYRASANVCFQATSNGTTSDGATMIARFVESMNRKGELTEWTVAVIGSQMEGRAIPGREYKMVSRSIDKKKAASRPDQYVFQGVAMGQDEAIDLSRTEYDGAEAQHALYEQQDERASKAAFFRLHRPATRGLLLLYPIVPRGEDGPVPPLEAGAVIGVAVSFPSSAHDVGEEYVCNPKMLEELYGRDFAEDTVRDAAEEAQAI
jgi:hypothetical protein